MGWLIELLFEAIREKVSQFIIDMMDVAAGMFTEILSCDLNLFEGLFGVAETLYANAILPMGIALLILILLWQLFKTMFGRTASSSEDPIELVFRSILSFFMLVYAKDIVNYVLEIAGTPYAWVTGTGITVESFSGYVTASEAAVSILGIDTISISFLLLIIQFVVAWNYFKLLFIMAERYVLLGVFSYTAPLAFATGGSKATNGILASWVKMFGGQVIVVILDAWCVKLFLSAYGNLMASGYGFTRFFAATLCLIGFCKIIMKLDSYMGSLGINLGRQSSGLSGMTALMMAGRMLGISSGRSMGGANRKSEAGHMNFGTGNSIPLSKAGLASDDAAEAAVSQAHMGVDGMQDMSEVGDEMQMRHAGVQDPMQENASLLSETENIPEGDTLPFGNPDDEEVFTVSSEPMVDPGEEMGTDDDIADFFDSMPFGAMEDDDQLNSSVPAMEDMVSYPNESALSAFSQAGTSMENETYDSPDMMGEGTVIKGGSGNPEPESPGADMLQEISSAGYGNGSREEAVPVKADAAMEQEAGRMGAEAAESPNIHEMPGGSGGQSLSLGTVSGGVASSGGPDASQKKDKGLDYDAGCYTVERNGERYKRYDASQYEKPEGTYHSIKENERTFYEVPEKAKAPNMLPKLNPVLGDDGRIHMEESRQKHNKAKGRPPHGKKTGTADQKRG